jgi:hypothetical protein
MITRSPTLANLTALAFSIYELALSGTGAPGREAEPPRVSSIQPDPGSVQLVPQETVADAMHPAPFACSLMASSHGGSTYLEGWLQARDAISAAYVLTVRGPGLSIDQGGDLTLSAGETAVLGEARVLGAADGLDATLTVTAGGQTYACALQNV